MITFASWKPAWKWHTFHVSVGFLLFLSLSTQLRLSLSYRGFFTFNFSGNKSDAGRMREREGLTFLERLLQRRIVLPRRVHLHFLRRSNAVSCPGCSYRCKSPFRINKNTNSRLVRASSQATLASFSHSRRFSSFSYSPSRENSERARQPAATAKRERDRDRDSERERERGGERARARTGCTRANVWERETHKEGEGEHKKETENDATRKDCRKKASDTRNGAIRNARVSRNRRRASDDQCNSVSDIDLDTWSRGAKNEALRKRSPEEEPRCARARALALAIVATVAISLSPRERRREGDRCPSLPPVCSCFRIRSSSHWPRETSARTRREERARKTRRRRGRDTGRARGTRIERERERGNNTAINNTREKTGRRMNEKDR